MDALKSVLSPFAMNTNAIHDTLVSTYKRSIVQDTVFSGLRRRNSWLLEELWKQRGESRSLRGMGSSTVSPHRFDSQRAS